MNTIVNTEKGSFAVLIDGGHVRSSYKDSLGRQHTAADIERLLVSVIDHPSVAGKEFFKSVYYDAAPFTGTTVNPLDGTTLNYRRTAGFSVSSRVFREIGTLLRTSVSLGHLTHQGWTVPDYVVKAKTTERFGFPSWPPDMESFTVTADDLCPNIAQKGVDTDIAFDMGMIAATGQVTDVVLVSRDTDFVPAMRKLMFLGIRVHVLVFDTPAPAEMLRTATSVIHMPLGADGRRPFFMCEEFLPPVIGGEDESVSEAGRNAA